jgi:hypothetical protein
MKRSKLIKCLGITGVMLGVGTMVPVVLTSCNKADDTFEYFKFKSIKGENFKVD